MALPHVPNHQQQTRPKKTHQQWKRHELLECSIQSPQVRRSTGKLFKVITSIYYLAHGRNFNAILKFLIETVND